jgi:Trk-type K+ transport system membrane component
MFIGGVLFLLYVNLWKNKKSLSPEHYYYSSNFLKYPKYSLSISIFLGPLYCLGIICLMIKERKDFSWKHVDSWDKK